MSVPPKMLLCPPHYWPSKPWSTRAIMVMLLGSYLRLRRRARKGRARAQGTIPCNTPLATMRTGVSCISANATATCEHSPSLRQAMTKHSQQQPHPLVQNNKTKPSDD